MSERTAFYPERFKNASRFYTSGRPTYPRLLARRVATLVGVSKRHDVLDLGTAPGFLARALITANATERPAPTTQEKTAP